MIHIYNTKQFKLIYFKLKLLRHVILSYIYICIVRNWCMDIIMIYLQYFSLNIAPILLEYLLVLRFPVGKKLQMKFTRAINGSLVYAEAVSTIKGVSRRSATKWTHSKGWTHKRAHTLSRRNINLWGGVRAQC